MSSSLPPADPDVPALLPLLGPEAAGVLSAVVEMADGILRSHRVSQVRYVPGRSVTAQYRCEVAWDDGGARSETLVVASGIDVPEGTPVMRAGDVDVAVWRFPHDPFLPGLASAADAERTSGLLEQLGARPGRARLRTRAYRAGRRAVIEAAADSQRVFLKVLRPARVAALQKRHVALAQHLPVPVSYGWSAESGIVALQALGGRTLRDAIDGRATHLPEPDVILALLDRIPAVEGSPQVPGPHLRAPEHAALLESVHPSLGTRLDVIVSALGQVEPEVQTAVHGDFHSSQLLVESGEIVGLVDVDTAGTGERANDLAGLLGHLATLPLGAGSRRAADAYGSALIAAFDRITDPGDLRRRVAAVVLGLATGPFRVYMPQWRAETERRVALVERWLRSADAAS